MKQKTHILIIVLLLIFSGYLFLENRDLKYSLSYERTIPEVELLHYLLFDKNTGRAVGGVSGFVAFENTDDQPKDFRKYVIIEALNNSDESGQLFSIEEIIASDHIAPRRFDKVILITAKNSPGTLTLTDINGIAYVIDKNSKQVSILDTQGDSAYLISDDREYRNFMKSFLSLKY